ncbi:hypothetical protein N9R81_00945 [Flavobacteriales bacterium]|nr:hypothetical protein [Flavobacteriales bacterium]
MTKLGDIFRKNLETQDVGDVSQHWDNLEAMLDKHDAMDKVGAYWWTGYGIFACLGIIASFLFIGNFEISRDYADVSKTKKQEVDGTQLEKNGGISRKSNAENNVNEDEDTKFVNSVAGDESVTKNKGDISKVNITTSIKENHREEPFSRSLRVLNKPNHEFEQDNKNVVSKYTQNNTEHLADNMISKKVEKATGIVPPINVIGGSLNGDGEEAERMDPLFLSNISNVQENEFPKFDFLEEDKSKLRISIGIYAGPMMVGKTVDAGEGATFAKRRKEEEYNTLSFNSGVDLSFSLGKFSLGTGINIHQQGEIVDYTNQYEVWSIKESQTFEITDNSYWQMNTSTFTIITDNNFAENVDTVLTYYDESQGSYTTDTVNYQSYVINDLGTQEFNLQDSVFIVQVDSTLKSTVLDSSLVIVNDIRNPIERTKTRFTYIEVPILMGYEVPINRIKLGFKTGVGVGFLTKHQAKYILGDYQTPTEVDRSQVNQLVINYLLRCSVTYSLTENLAVKMEPFYRANITNVLATPNYSQKYWNIGLNMGLYYAF